MQTTYYGIFTDGQTIEKLTLAEVNDVEGIEHIVKCVKNDTWASPKTFTILNEDGTRKRFTIGEFEVLDIGEESPGTNGNDKQVTLKEIRTGNRVKVRIKTSGIDFLKDELMPLLEELNQCGSWFMYQKLKELDQVKRENLRLTSKIEELQQRLDG